jgi:hypothetical protein
MVTAEGEHPIPMVIGAKYELRLTLADTTWMAPLVINLMAMPNPGLAGKQAGRKDLINPRCPDRVQPRPLKAEIQDGIITLPVEVRDYPMLIKWVRTRDREPPNRGHAERREDKPVFKRVAIQDLRS